MDRYRLLESYYPIKKKIRGTRDQCSPPVREIRVPIAVITDTCITGYAAYAIYQNATNGIHGAGAGIGALIGSLTRTTYRVEESELIVSIPEAAEFAIYTDTYDITVAKIAAHTNTQPTQYHRYLGRFPRSATVDDPQGFVWHIYDNLGDKLSAHKMSTGVWIACPQHVLMYLLHLEDLWFYRDMRSVVEMAENYREPKIGEFDREIFYPHLETYGSELVNEAVSRAHREFEDQSVRSEVPRNVNLVDDTCEADNTFDYASEYFQIDGLKIE
jgi:hypothetical protein